MEHLEIGRTCVGEGWPATVLEPVEPLRAACAIVPPGTVEDMVAAVAALKAGRPGVQVVVEVASLEAPALRRLLDAGADAVRAVGSESGSPRSAPGEGLGLTGREVEVLAFLGAGYSNKEVARRLAVSVRTVETHRFNLRRKTSSGRLRDLVRLARRMGLTAGEDSDPRPAARRA